MAGPLPVNLSKASRRKIVRGLDDVNRRLETLKRSPETVAAQARGLFRGAHRIMNASKRIVPVRFGVLRASGVVDVPDVRRDRVTQTLGYGGPAVPYALKVHEDPRAYHKPPTQYKYLEQPYLELRHLAFNDVEVEMRARMRKLGKTIRRL
jgi:hypothetical protein